ncbi:MAG: hypothetical protein AAF485_06200 [Chloroflexota bacterium]
MKLLTCDAKTLMQGLKAAAKIEALLCQEAWLQRYQFEEEWDTDVKMARFSNGQGDDIFVLESPDGVIIKGFDHESIVSPYARADHSLWPGMFEGIPPTLSKLLDDPAVVKEDATFVHWLSENTDKWQRGSVKFSNNETDGSDWLLDMLPLTAGSYIKAARNYFEEGFEAFDHRLIYQQFEFKEGS